MFFYKNRHVIDKASWADQHNKKASEALNPEHHGHRSVDIYPCIASLSVAIRLESSCHGHFLGNIQQVDTDSSSFVWFEPASTQNLLEMAQVPLRMARDILEAIREDVDIFQEVQPLVQKKRCTTCDTKWYKYHCRPMALSFCWVNTLTMWPY